MSYKFSQILLGYLVLWFVTIAFVITSSVYSTVLGVIIAAYVTFATALFLVVVGFSSDAALRWQDVVITTLKTPVWLVMFVVKEYSK